ncbi:MAG: TusE/DsrC/DsvC family sulfur relay protein [Pseudomonadota bacterium]|nr:TusE/DsrC/DsvC family sulfur relay protein [Pseudomonadota bacterium]
MTQETFSFTYNGQEIPTDKAGYLLDYTLWEEGMVESLAQQENIELTDAHWEVVRFVRAFYEEYETSPAIRALVKAMANKFGPEKGNSRYLQRLFKKGPAKQATKLAGLPKPAKCL